MQRVSTVKHIYINEMRQFKWLFKYHDNVGDSAGDRGALIKYIQGPRFTSRINSTNRPHPNPPISLWRYRILVSLGNIYIYVAKFYIRMRCFIMLIIETLISRNCFPALAHPVIKYQKFHRLPRQPSFTPFYPLLKGSNFLRTVLICCFLAVAS